MSSRATPAITSKLVARTTNTATQRYESQRTVSRDTFRIAPPCPLAPTPSIRSMCQCAADEPVTVVRIRRTWQPITGSAARQHLDRARHQRLLLFHLPATQAREDRTQRLRHVIVLTFAVRLLPLRDELRQVVQRDTTVLDDADLRVRRRCRALIDGNQLFMQFLARPQTGVECRRCRRSATAVICAAGCARGRGCAPARPSRA
jgi:hypothetical protein